MIKKLELKNNEDLHIDILEYDNLKELKELHLQKNDISDIKVLEKTK